MDIVKIDNNEYVRLADHQRALAHLQTTLCDAYKNTIAQLEFAATITAASLAEQAQTIAQLRSALQPHYDAIAQRQTEALLQEFDGELCLCQVMSNEQNND